MTPQRTTPPLSAIILAATVIVFTYQNAAYARSKIRATSTVNNDTVLVHDTQLLLSQSGFYTGHLDGRCDPQTEHAINTYVGTLSQKPNGTACSGPFLKTIIDTLLLSAAHVIHPTNDTATINLLSSKVEAIKDDVNKTKSAETEDITSIKSELSKTNSAVTAVKDSIITNFTNEYSSLAGLGISSFVAFIGLLGASIIGIYSILHHYITNKHNELLASSENKLLVMIATHNSEIAAMAETAHADISTRIYTMFSAHCINLYKDLPEPAGKHWPMYRSYLEIAVYMSTYGYLHAILILKSVEKTNKEPSDVQKAVLRSALNNYVYYLSEMNRKEDRSNIEEGIHKLEKIINEEQNNSESWQYHDPLAWANLHLKRTSIQESTRAIQNLISRKDLDLKWRAELAKRYDFYNLCHTPEEKISLFIDTELSEFIKMASVPAAVAGQGQPQTQN
jgi:hypothetical protein